MPALLALAATCGAQPAGGPSRVRAADSAGYALPRLTDRVVDAAHLLTAGDRAAAIAASARLERATGHQVVVVMVPSLGGHAIEDYALRLGNVRGVGRRGFNDGVLVVVARREHAVRIEVGCGLESALTNAEAKTIIDRDMLPAFRAGAFGLGIRRAVNGIAREIAPAGVAA